MAGITVNLLGVAAAGAAALGLLSSIRSLIQWQDTEGEGPS